MTDRHRVRADLALILKQTNLKIYIEITKYLIRVAINYINIKYKFQYPMKQYLTLIYLLYSFCVLMFY